MKVITNIIIKWDPRNLTIHSIPTIHTDHQVPEYKTIRLLQKTTSQSKVLLRFHLTLPPNTIIRAILFPRHTFTVTQNNRMIQYQ